ncbi:MAG: class I SAM-dependent methyltransferase [Pseudomonadota bacterium]|nr:class I SAM-dependent methyltransferase [Pseudomonadota bacterium]
MQAGQFSLTALTAAGLRAAHQVADGASVFVDPLAAKILRDDLQVHIDRAADPVLRPLRLFVALRSRLAEDHARARIGQGLRQVVVLGAGLDTFGCRLAPVEGLAVFEVDHRDTQAEKRRRLAAAGVATPAHLRFAPCDFERDSLGESLAAAGFDDNAPAAFLWLGVTPYLTRAAFEATLRFVAGLKGGGSIVFDYANPTDSIDSPGHRLFHERMAARVAELGETFRSAFATPELHAFLTALGAREIDDYGPRRIADLFSRDGPPPPENGGHILRALFAGK